MEITANAIQTVTPGSNVLFTETAVAGCPSIMHRDGSGIVTLRGITNTQERARFRVTFGANIALPAGTTPVVPVSLAISLGGESLAVTSMISTPAAADQYNNVFGSAFLDIPAGCCSQIAIRNNGTTDVLVQNANLIVERVA